MQATSCLVVALTSLRWIFPRRQVIVSSMGAATSSSHDMKQYYQLVVDADGETSVVRRSLSNVQRVGYSNVPQFCKALDSEVAVPTGVV